MADTVQEIVKELDPTGKFYVLTCIKGHKMTKWKEGDPDRDYNSYSIVYCSSTAETSEYRCVTDEEDSERKKKVEEILYKEYLEEQERRKQEEIERKLQEELSLLNK